MNLRTEDALGYWGLTVAGLVFFLAGMVNATDAYSVSDMLTDPIVIAFGVLGIPVVSLFVLLRNREKGDE